jgi:outer membrane lipoprotein carrier protein
LVERFLGNSVKRKKEKAQDKKAKVKRQRAKRMVKLRNLYLLLVISSILLFPTPGQSQSPSLDEVVAKVQEQYETHDDFKASFVQESLVKSLGKKQVSEGVVYFKKPGKMRWVYQKPIRQEIISDGKNLWNYRPDEKQVVVTPVSQAVQGQIPSTFLAGLGNLRMDFQTRWAKEPTPKDNYSLEFTPNDFQGSLEKLTLLVDRENFKILQANIRDIMGNVTQISFSKIQFNNRLSDSLFAFAPPQGVEVFRMPGAPPAGKPEK